MISFTNAHNIQLFQDFINRESNSIILRDKNDSFRVILPDDFMSGIFNPDEYVSINGNYIYYNEARCNEIKLTDEERFSCIAHELGHYYDETEKNEYNGKNSRYKPRKLSDSRSCPRPSGICRRYE